MGSVRKIRCNSEDKNYVPEAPFQKYETYVIKENGYYFASYTVLKKRVEESLLVARLRAQRFVDQEKALGLLGK